MLNKKVNNKTIEELENDFWVPPPRFPTELVKSVFLLRQKRLRDLDSNDLRILISQNVGLKYLIPIAVDILTDDVLHEAIYYPGDLLSAVLSIENDYWLKSPTELNLFISLLRQSKNQISNEDEIDEVDEELISSVNDFLSKYDSESSPLNRSD